MTEKYGNPAENKSYKFTFSLNDTTAGLSLYLKCDICGKISKEANGGSLYIYMSGGGKNYNKDNGYIPFPIEICDKDVAGFKSGDPSMTTNLSHYLDKNMATIANFYILQDD